MEDFKTIWDGLDIPALQELQDNWAKAMGLAFVTVDYKGIPVTRYSRFSPYCKLGRTRQGFAELCSQCDAHGGLHAAITGQPYIYRCHAGLVDFSVPLILNNSYIGAVLGGQVRLEDGVESSLERIIPQVSSWEKDPELQEAFQRNEEVAYDKIEAAVKIIRDMIVHMVQREYTLAQRKTLEEEATQREEERATRGELEGILRQQEDNALKLQADNQYFYSVMNMVSRLAYEEQAPKTEAVIYDFVDMIRYSTEQGRTLSTLGEEVDYVEALLRIQQAWVGEELVFSLSVPDYYKKIHCPFLLLQPLIEGCLLCNQATKVEPCTLSLQAEEEGKDVIITLSTNQEGLTLDQLGEHLSSPVHGKKSTAHDADRSLRRLYGKRYGLCFDKRKDHRPGTAITFRLRLKGETGEF